MRSTRLHWAEHPPAGPPIDWPRFRSQQALQRRPAQELEMAMPSDRIGRAARRQKGSGLPHSIGFTVREFCRWQAFLAH
jgi:hypothetical protein